MSFSREVLAAAAEEIPHEEEMPDFEEAFLDQVDHLSNWSLFARNRLRRRPDWLAWLARPDHTKMPFPALSFEKCWDDGFAQGLPVSPNLKTIGDALRQFRSLMSLRIAFREVNELASTAECLLEMSTLAVFCLQKVFNAILQDLEARMGKPWDETKAHPARCCVIGMGKLGGMELNFCSDVDLIFIYDGEGKCRKNSKATEMATREFFARLVQMVVAFLQERTEQGFLFNVDLRLRPEGETGPLIKNMQATENYYFTVGQTWERMALARAMPVAGDLSLGGEFLEEIHSFVQPRHPPPTIIQELAATRARFGGDRNDPENQANIKTGWGGIREVEFFTQGLQVLHAGAQPFLQTRSTQDALDRLSQYNIINEKEKEDILTAYMLLRKVENRLQIEQENPAHELPVNEEKRQSLAESLGHVNWLQLEDELTSHRGTVRNAYESLFGKNTGDDTFEEWFAFFSGAPATGNTARKISEWLGSGEDVSEQLRVFVLGGHTNFLTREHVTLFLSLAEHFPKVLAQLAFPVKTLLRLGRFAEHYGSRKGLFKTCALTPHLFEMLCLLFDRSPFIHGVLCKHPEILDEMLTQPVNRLKPPEETAQELKKLPQDENFPKWLWLYVRAEQIRATMGEHLGYFDTPVIEKNLSRLADSVLRFLLKQLEIEKQLAIVALGKYGAEELNIGSDLDLLIITGKKPNEELNRKARGFLKLASWLGSSGHTFDVDIRLRPFGEDGPLVVSMENLAAYHDKHAKLWERQCLTRARFVGGEINLGKKFNKLREKLLFEKDFGVRHVDEIFKMREKILREKAPGQNSWHFFKACRGGLVEIEFFVQALQMYHGRKIQALRPLTNTRELFRLLSKFKCLDKEGCAKLLLNYNFLRKLEFFLRRFYGNPVSALNLKTEENTVLRQWFLADSFQAFADEYQARLKKSWHEIKTNLEKTFGLDI